MNSYTDDPRQMATDALTLATPPAHSGIKTFISEEGVHALATALEAALDEVTSAELDQDKISKLEEEKAELEEVVADMKRKAKEFALEMETA